MPAETHMEQDPLGRESILQLIKDRLGEILEIDPNIVNEGDSFADDLDADSLALIELVDRDEESRGKDSGPTQDEKKLNEVENKDQGAAVASG